MGCHTWCYSENTKSLNELRKGCVEYIDLLIKDRLDSRVEFISDPDQYSIPPVTVSHRMRKILLKGCPHFVRNAINLKTFNKKIRRLKKLRSRVLHGCSKPNVVEYIYEHQPRLRLDGSFDSRMCIQRYNGKYYYEVDDFGNNLFRVKNYPEDILMSYEETIAMLEREKEGKWDDGTPVENNVWIRNDDDIKAFWDKYPNGLIRMG